MPVLEITNQDSTTNMAQVEYKAQVNKIEAIKLGEEFLNIDNNKTITIPLVKEEEIYSLFIKT